MVDAYIALTKFGRKKFIGGLPPDRFFAKPNFVHSAAPPSQGDGGFALFIGRLSEEKRHSHAASRVETVWHHLVPENRWRRTLET
jgi:hypothetical protein